MGEEVGWPVPGLCEGAGGVVWSTAGGADIAGGAGSAAEDEGTRGRWGRWRGSPFLRCVESREEGRPTRGGVGLCPSVPHFPPTAQTLDGWTGGRSAGRREGLARPSTPSSVHLHSPLPLHSRGSPPPVLLLVLFSPAFLSPHRSASVDFLVSSALARTSPLPLFPGVAATSSIPSIRLLSRAHKGTGGKWWSAQNGRGQPGVGLARPHTHHRSHLGKSQRRGRRRREGEPQLQWEGRRSGCGRQSGPIVAPSQVGREGGQGRGRRGNGPPSQRRRRPSHLPLTTAFLVVTRAPTHTKSCPACLRGERKELLHSASHREVVGNPPHNTRTATHPQLHTCHRCIESPITSCTRPWQALISPHSSPHPPTAIP